MNWDLSTVLFFISNKSFFRYTIYIHMLRTWVLPKQRPVTFSYLNAMNLKCFLQHQYMVNLSTESESLQSGYQIWFTETKTTFQASTIDLILIFIFKEFYKCFQKKNFSIRCYHDFLHQKWRKRGTNELSSDRIIIIRINYFISFIIPSNNCMVVEPDQIICNPKRLKDLRRILSHLKQRPHLWATGVTSSPWRWRETWGTVLVASCCGWPTEEGEPQLATPGEDCVVLWTWFIAPTLNTFSLYWLQQSANNWIYENHVNVTPREHLHVGWWWIGCLW